jgi:hypothetical protein
MPSLYRAATRFGAALLRICEGSARAAFHDHPEWSIPTPEKTARSIAKRAAGTIAAEWSRLSAVAAKAATVAQPAGASVDPAGDAGGALSPPPARTRSQSSRPGPAAGVVVDAAPARPPQLARARKRGMEAAHKAVGAMIRETTDAARAHLISVEEERIRVTALRDALRTIRRCIDGELQGMARR